MTSTPIHIKQDYIVSVSLKDLNAPALCLKKVLDFVLSLLCMYMVFSKRKDSVVGKFPYTKHVYLNKSLHVT